MHVKINILLLYFCRNTMYGIEYSVSEFIFIKLLLCEIYIPTKLLYSYVPYINSYNV